MQNRTYMFPLTSTDRYLCLSTDALWLDSPSQEFKNRGERGIMESIMLLVCCSVVPVTLLVHLAVLAAHLDLAVALVALPVTVTRRRVPLHVDRGREVGDILRSEGEGLVCQLSLPGNCS